MFLTAWVFEVRICPTLLNDITETKIQSDTSPQPGIIFFAMARLAASIVQVSYPLKFLLIDSYPQNSILPKGCP